MSDSLTKPVMLELPVALIREVKVDAARREITLKRWWKEAGEARLAAKESVEAVSQ